MLVAHLSNSHKTNKTGQISTIICPDLNIETTSQNPERKLCRMIVERYPHLAKEQLKIYRKGTHSSTVKNIDRFSKKTIKEDDIHGLHEVPYRVYPSES